MNDRIYNILIGIFFLSCIIISGIGLYFGMKETINTPKPIVYRFENVEIENLREDSRIGSYIFNYNNKMSTSYYEIKYFYFQINNGTDTFNCTYSKSASKIMIPNMYSKCYYILEEGQIINCTGIITNNSLAVRSIEK